LKNDFNRFDYSMNMIIDLCLIDNNRWDFSFVEVTADHINIRAD